MKFYLPDTKFVMMLTVSLAALTIGAAALGKSATVKQYLGIG